MLGQIQICHHLIWFKLKKCQSVIAFINSGSCFCTDLQVYFHNLNK